jgi:hypothetical protein
MKTFKIVQHSTYIKFARGSHGFKVIRGEERERGLLKGSDIDIFLCYESVGTTEATAHSDEYVCAGTASMKDDETSYAPCAVICTHPCKHERMHRHTC